MDDAPRQYPGRAPVLTHWPASAPVVGAVLALHGGRVAGKRPVTRLDLPVLRMHAIARSVHRAVAPLGISVWTLRFAVQGWNGPEASPVADARWALARIAATDDVQVALLGHSMGGRTSLRVVGEPNVAGAVVLAPWFPPGERVGELAGRRLVIAHGTSDRTTDPQASRAYAAAARAVAEDVELIDVPSDGHALLRSPSVWNEIAATGVVDVLGVSRPPASPPGR